MKFIYFLIIFGVFFLLGFNIVNASETINNFSNYATSTSYILTSATTTTENIEIKFKFDSTFDGTDTISIMPTNKYDGAWWFKINIKATTSGAWIQLDNGLAVFTEEFTGLTYDTDYVLRIYISDSGSDNFIRLKLNGDYNPTLRDIYDNDVSYNKIDLSLTGTANFYFYYIYIGENTYTNPDNVEIIELATTTQDIFIGTESYLRYQNKKCIINEDCYFKLQYGFQAIGDTINIYEDTDNDGDKDSLATSTILKLKNLLYIDVLLNEKSEAGNYYYCIESENLDKTYCNLTIQYTESELYNVFGDITSEHICDDLTTGSTTWEYIEYGMTCSLRKIGVYFLIPSTRTMNRFIDELQNAKENFPISYITQTYDIFNAVGTNYSSPSIPLKFAEPRSGVMTTRATLTLSESNLRNAVGDGIFDKVFNLMKNLIYLLGFGYIVMRILKLGKGSDPTIKMVNDDRVNERLKKRHDYIKGK